MKPAVLCIGRDAITKVQHSFESINQIPENKYHFLNREVVDDVNDTFIGHLFPQVIPYIIVKFKDRYLTYTRPAKSGETRLIGRRSIGLGGHVDITDISVEKWSTGNEVSYVNTLMDAVDRELLEEIGFDASKFNEDIFKHLIVMDNTDNPVDRVHVGLVGIIEIDDISKLHPSDEIGEVFFATKEHMLEQIEEFENWSKHVINEYL